MRSFTSRLIEGGRLTGGPLLFAALATGALAACSGGASPGRPDPDRSAPLGRPLETYEQLGFIAGPSHFPVVARVATVAGPADSTYVLLALSMPANALRFQREPEGFAAEYVVVATFEQDSQVVKRVERRDAVRVPSFAETGRTDESIVYQDAVLLEPGRYDVTFQARDANSSRGFRSREVIEVPRYGGSAYRLASPLLIYGGEGRSALDQLPALIMNPRNTVAFGDEDPRVYIEAYGLDVGETVTMRVTDGLGTTVWSTEAAVHGDSSDVRSTMVELPTTALPAGRLWLEVEDRAGRAAPARAPIVVSISDHWMVANFEEVVDFLAYIAPQSELDSLRTGTPAEQAERWEDFWRSRDPLPATPINEFREEFFQRVRTATEQFSEPGGTPGWKTDRGEVYIVMGPPDFARDGYLGGWNESDGPPNALDWIYTDVPGGRLELLFVERSGFGRWELDPQSALAFRAVAERMKPRAR